MSAFLTAALNGAYATFRWWLGTDQFDRISTVVRNLIFSDLPGEDKKKIVIDTFWDEVERLKKQWSTGMILDGIIWLTRARFEQT
jgi:hypothetical protein